MLPQPRGVRGGTGPAHPPLRPSVIHYNQRKRLNGYRGHYYHVSSMCWRGYSPNGAGPGRAGTQGSAYGQTPNPHFSLSAVALLANFLIAPISPHTARFAPAVWRPIASLIESEKNLTPPCFENTSNPLQKFDIANRFVH